MEIIRINLMHIRSGNKITFNLGKEAHVIVAKSAFSSRLSIVKLYYAELLRDSLKD